MVNAVCYSIVQEAYLSGTGGNNTMVRTSLEYR